MILNAVKIRNLENDIFKGSYQDGIEEVITNHILNFILQTELVGTN